MFFVFIVSFSQMAKAVKLPAVMVGRDANADGKLTLEELKKTK